MGDDCPMHTRSLGATGTAIPNPLALSHLQRKHAKEHNYKGTYDNERPLRIPRWGVSFGRRRRCLISTRDSASEIEDFLWAGAVGGIASVMGEIFLKEKLAARRKEHR